MRLTRSNARRAMPALALALGVSLITMPSAQAAPDVTVKGVEAAFHEAEAMNEQVNQLGEDIKKTSKQIDDLSSEITDQTAVFNTQREALSTTIVQQQMDAPLGTTASLLGSGDPETFIDGLGAVQALNSTRTDALDSFVQVSNQLKNRQTQLDDRRASMRADQKDVAAKQAEIQTKYEAAKADLARLTAAQKASLDAPAPAADTKTDADADADVKVPASGRAKAAVDFALAQIGDPYVYGGTGPNSWDCSGLVMKAWAAAGVSVPRVVGPQMSAAKRIPMGQLQPGDIVAYGDMSHDGLYLGNGRVVHAPRPGKSVEITSLSGFSVAGRVG